MTNERCLRTRIERDATRLQLEASDQPLLNELPKLFKQLYGTANESIEQRLKVCRELRELIDKLPSDSTSLISVKRQIERRVDVVEAGLLSAQNSAHSKDLLALTDEIAIRTAIDFEMSGRAFHGERVLKALDELRAKHPDAYAKLNPLIQYHYQNTNLRVVFSEEMASLIVHRLQLDMDCIAECILGAWVTGAQNTEVKTRADILPCDSVGKWNVLGEGRTNSNTQAQKGPATVHTIGKHSFVLSNQMSFVGPHIQLDPATICVNANNYNVGVQTNFDQIPVLRVVARGVARGEAERTRLQAEQIAAGKISRAGLPKFESILESRFGAVNEALANGAELRMDIYGQPPEYRSHSTDTHLFIESQTVLSNNLGGAAPPEFPLPGGTMTFQIHESLVNTVIDGLGLVAEQKVNDLLQELPIDEIRVPDKLLEKLRERLSGEQFKAELRQILPLADEELLEVVAELIPGLGLIGINKLEDFRKEHSEQLKEIEKHLSKSGIPEFRFADCDPVRIRFDEGAIVVVFGPRPQHENIKTGVLKLDLKVEDGKVGLRLPEEIPEEVESRLNGLLEPLKEKLKDQLKTKLRDRLPEEILDSSENLGLSHLHLEFKNAQLSDGWLTLEVGATLKPTEPTAK
ncbi:MAG: hypothetical protein KDA88_01635 [Planctomycetaceae bacterium]|nr:hypothetical protein [Planctomycetaceae bacterium]